jgi:8-oxo-dGTP pyrophosphatase MutT (NUDIX family)
MRQEVNTETIKKFDYPTLIQKLRSTLTPVAEFPNCDADQRIPAAVLIPLLWQADEWHILYTKRTNGVATHQGEISFPGGASELVDRSPLDTAIRETREEIGVQSEEIELLGTLEPYPTISNYCVLPVVGILNWPVEIKLNTEEVDKLLVIPVTWLMQASNWYESDYIHPSGKISKVIRYIPYQEETLWGMTARITRLVLDRI